MKKTFGIIFTIIGIVTALSGIVTAILCLISKKLVQGSFSIPGGADGPTTIIYAGKLGGGNTLAIAGILAVVSMISIVAGSIILARKK